jgi:large subunit ribosomal protein L25
VIRENGHNAVLTLDIDSETELALTKTVTTHPLKNYIEHVDLLLVRRGEKVTVDLPVVLTGEGAPGTLVTQDLTSVQIEVDAINIPEQVEFEVSGIAAGTQVHASDLVLPAGVTLITDPDALVVAVNAAPTAAQLDGEESVEATEATEES